MRYLPETGDTQHTPRLLSSIQMISPTRQVMMAVDECKRRTASLRGCCFRFFLGFTADAGDDELSQAGLLAGVSRGHAVAL